MTHTSVTKLLDGIRLDRTTGFARLVEATYSDMHRLAAVRLGRRPDARLDVSGVGPTALANETFERLMLQRNIAENREQFFALATRVMMRVLLDHKRRVRTDRRGGRVGMQSLELGVTCAHQSDASEGVEISELMRKAMVQLHKLDPRKAETVTLHALCGVTLERTAELTGVSRATAERDWAFARAWLIAWIEERTA